MSDAAALMLAAAYLAANGCPILSALFIVLAFIVPGQGEKK